MNNTNALASSTLSGKGFKQLQPDNEKLTSLHGQMGEMENDFEDMKRAREEAKKQLEAKFQDVHRKIQITKEFVVSEGKRINDTLVAFQSKFETELATLSTKFQDQHEKIIEDMNKRFLETNERCNELERLIQQEKEERLRQTDEQLKPIKAHLNALQEAYETEKSTRIQKEKEILQKLSDEVYVLTEKLDKEKTDRILKIKELSDETKYELQQQEKNSETFHKKAIEEFGRIADGIQKEMDNRFDHQDKIVDNLSNMVKTFQDTLKVIGGTS
jgi:DNA repair exonuclease SbcCD ATPase subunit